MAIRLIIDSTCDLPRELIKDDFVTCIPLKLNIDGKDYLDGIDINTQQFFELLKKSKNLPKTTQISQYQFEEIFKSALDKDEEILGIFLSSKLSGTFNSARLAKEELNSNKIEIVDSTLTTFPFRALVEQAIKLIKQGLSLLEIKNKLEILKTKIKTLAVISDLTYLRRGGRLSSASALIATTLHLRPIVVVENGEIKAIAKIVGTGRALNAIAKMFNEKAVDFNYPIYLADADGIELKQRFVNVLKEETNIFNQAEEIIDCTVGATTGSYTGPNCTGISFFIK